MGGAAEMGAHLYEFLMEFIVFIYVVHSVGEVPRDPRVSSVGCPEREVSCLEEG